MKMKNNHIWTLMAVLPLAAVLSACSVDISQDDPAEIRLSLSYPGTKATDDGFGPGDVAGVYITRYGEDGKALPLQVGGNYASNIKASFDGSTWSLSPKMFWEDGMNYDVYAYYPYMDVTSVNAMPFTISEDQSVGATATSMSAYEASDFLWAKKANVSQTATLPLTFSHRMSKVIVNVIKGIDYEGDIPQNLEVYIHNTVTDALIDFTTGDVVKDPYSTPSSIKMRKIGTDSFEAIVVPQRIVNRLPMFEVMSEDVSYLLETKFVYSPGMCHTVNITINNNPEQVRIDIGGYVEGWN